MDLVYIVLSIIGANIFSFFIFKNRILNQFVLITSIILVFLLSPKYLYEYGVTDTNVLDTFFEEKK